MTITGGGFQPGETVTLHLQEIPYIDSHSDMTAVVQADGTFTNSQFSPDEHDLDIRFYLTATGSTSGTTAQTTFTDAKNVTVAFAGTGSGSVSSNPVGISCTDTGGNLSGTCTVSVGNTAQVTLTATPASPSTVGAWTVPPGYTINSGCSNRQHNVYLHPGNSLKPSLLLSIPARSAQALPTISASPTSVVADGATTSTVTVTLRDSGGNPVGGKAVSITAGSGSSIVSPASATSTASGDWPPLR